MNEQQNVKTIQEVYAAFGRGDVAFIVAKLTDDVRWVSCEDLFVRAVSRSCTGGRLPMSWSASICVR